MQTSRSASCHLSILSSGSIYFAAPATLPVYTNGFFFPNPPVFCSALPYVVAATTREGTMRPLNSTSPFVFRLSGLLLSVFIYGTITAQFIPSIKTVLAALCAISSSFFFKVSVPLSLCLCSDLWHPWQKTEIKCYINPQWFTLTASSHTSTQRHFCIKRYAFILHPFLLVTKKSSSRSVAGPTRARRSLAVRLTLAFLPNSVSWVWEGSAASGGNACILQIGWESSPVNEPQSDTRLISGPTREDLASWAVW